jgi:hypothetical protein
VNTSFSFSNQIRVKSSPSVPLKMYIFYFITLLALVHKTTIISSPSIDLGLGRQLTVLVALVLWIVQDKNQFTK